MNKNYIKKRINKETNKAADENPAGVAAPPAKKGATKGKRRRRAGRRTTIDADTGDYGVHTSKPRSGSLKVNNNTFEDDECSDSFEETPGITTMRSAPGTSREDKKLNYYLEMIQRQVTAEQKKTKKKEAKDKNQNRSEAKVWMKNAIPQITDSVEITLVHDFDLDLDILAQDLHADTCGASSKGDKGKTSTDIYLWCEGDNVSWQNSENNSVSTLDRLRTPPQTHLKTGSWVLQKEEALFSNMRISNLADSEIFKNDKPATQPCQINIAYQAEVNSTSVGANKPSLKEAFWESILAHTKKIQYGLSDVKRNATECKLELPNIEDNCAKRHVANVARKAINKSAKLQSMRQVKSVGYRVPEVADVIIKTHSPKAKPVFMITKSKDNFKSRMARLASTTSTTVSSQDTGSRDKSGVETIEKDAAVLLVN